MSTDFILDGIELPSDLQWGDEFTAWKVGQTNSSIWQQERTVKGANISRKAWPTIHACVCAKGVI